MAGEKMNKQKSKTRMIEINRPNYVRLLIAVVGGNADEELKSWAELELLRLATKGGTAI
tara:strand:- start:3096 stop:3272 length:177 start_codon:yes stop_codon:yes gene_type:complete